MTIPYNEIDTNIIALVRALNEFDGLTTIGSCGGHPNPTICQEPEGSWSIIMKFDHGNDGWLALEFLSWLINHDAANAGKRVLLYPTARPPHLNHPGRVLSFVFKGENEDPDEWAMWIHQVRIECYISPVVESKILLVGGC